MKRSVRVVESVDEAERVVFGRVARAPWAKLAGQSFDSAIVDESEGFDAIAFAEGLVVGGGVLVVVAQKKSESLAVWPYSVDDVGTRLWARVRAELEHVPPSGGAVPVRAALPSCDGATLGGGTPSRSWSAPPEAGTAEQTAVVDALARLFASSTPSLAVLTAGRGRGKSSALGLALARAPVRAAITAPSIDNAREILRFAPHVGFFDAIGLPDVDVIIVDEAAQLPVPVLRALTLRHPRATIAFSTTTHGYEGTGRGFALRFVPWLEKNDARPLTSLTLAQPIRHDADDPVERAVFRSLCLDAELADVAGPLDAPRRLERDELRGPLVRSLFALLVHAHYRTTPNDLHRILDAPNLDVHAICAGEIVAAATVVAREGSLPPDMCADLARGRRRIRGHALADTLVTHAGHADAGSLSMIRSVRIAVHPALRRRGLARALVAHVHRSYDVDLFGTLFGATTELVELRRSLGYDVVRVGSSHGARSGEPSVVMVRPSSPAAQNVVDDLRVDLARNLPIELELFDDALALEPGLAAALAHGLPTPPPLSSDDVRARVADYVSGPRPFEAAAYAVSRFVAAADLSILDDIARAVVAGRVLERRSWRDVAGAARVTIPRAMRSLRPAVATLLARDRSR